MPGVQRLTVDDDAAGQRLDNFVLARLKRLPRSRAYRMVRKGEVRVNGGRSAPTYRLQAGDEVRLPPWRDDGPEQSERTPSHRLRSLLEASICFEDDGLLVLDKPAGIAVHGGSGVDLGVIEALRAARGRTQAAAGPSPGSRDVGASSDRAPSQRAQCAAGNHSGAGDPKAV